MSGGKREDIVPETGRRGDQPAHRPGQPGAADETRPGPSPHSPHPAGPHPPYQKGVGEAQDGKSQRKVPAQRHLP